MLILCGMLSAFGYSAFIQSPIPPSTSKNFFKDVDGDGKMDQVEIVFLGNLSREYLDSTVARLEIDWPDSNGISKTLSYPGAAIPFDSTHRNSIILDLSEKKNIASKTVLGLSSQTARIYFADSSQMPISMREKLSPIVESAYLSHHATGKDSLKVRFSEPVFESTPNADFLEYKHNGSIQTISATKVEWSEDHSTVRLIWNAGQGLPLPRDSVRILAGAVHDSSQNSSLENSPFAKISGAYPFQIRTNSLAYVDDSKSRSNIPIFERIFADTSAHRPLSSELGIAFDLGGKDFQEFVQEIVTPLHKHGKLCHERFFHHKMLGFFFPARKLPRSPANILPQMESDGERPFRRRDRRLSRQNFCSSPLQRQNPLEKRHRQELRTNLGNQKEFKLDGII